MNSNRLVNRVCKRRAQGTYSAVQMRFWLPDSPRAAVRWLERKRILAVAAMLVVSVAFSPSLRAGIIYTAGTETAAQGGTVSVPITVGFTSPPNSGNDTYWLNIGFNLTWDAGMLTYQSVTLNGNPVFPWDQANFHSPTANQLNFSWFDLNLVGYQVADQSTLFTVNFTASGNTPINFGSVSVINLTDSTGTDRSQVTPTFTAGSITIVPEPIDWALGLFACLFIGGAAVRWVSHRRLSLQPARAVSQANPRA